MMMIISREYFTNMTYIIFIFNCLIKELMLNFQIIDMKLFLFIKTYEIVTLLEYISWNNLIAIESEIPHLVDVIV